VARYKLRVPGAGTYLHGDGPEAVVARDIDEARILLEEFEVRSYIGWCRVVYKRDIDCGDAFEGAEPGDTMVEYCHDDGRELGESECRVWVTGPPSLREWKIDPVGPEPVDFAEIPVGTRFALERRSSVDDDEVWEVDVRDVRSGAFLGGKEADEPGPVRTVRIPKGGSIYLMPYMGNFRPPFRYRLTVQGEVAEGSEQEMHDLLRWVEAEHTASWRRDLYAEAAA
jgi:hypothetical protein